MCHVCVCELENRTYNKRHKKYLNTAQYIND